MAIVAAYNAKALFVDGRVPDMSAYERHLTLDSGVTLAPGGGLSCTTGGGSKAYVADDYIGAGASVSCFARVRSLSATPGRRTIAAISRGTSGVVRFLLSNAAGNVEVEYGAPASLQHFTTSVSLLDGADHLVGFTIDVLSGSPVWRIWADSVIVASGTPTADLPSASGVFTLGKGDNLAGAPGVADAVIEDLRWFNDPVYPAEAYLFDTPVTNLTVAAFNFDAATGTLVADQTQRHNDLTLTANGQWVPGVDGTGIGPIATGNPAAAGTDLELYDGTFDRLSITGWVKVVAGGSAAPFISLEDASGTPVFQLFKGGANGLLLKAWGDSGTWPFLDGSYYFGADGALSASEFRFIHVNVNPTGLLIQVWDASGNVVDDYQNNTFGTPPTNLPILEGITTLRVSGAVGAGGQVAVDDLRVIRNYLNPLALTTLRTTHVTQEPAGVIPATFDTTVGAATADGGSTMWAGAGTVSATAGSASTGGGDATFTGAAVLAAAAGSADAAGGSGTFAVSAGFATTSGGADAGGGAAGLAGAATITTTAAAAAAAGGDGQFTAATAGLITATTGVAVADGGVATFGDPVFPPVPARRTLTGGVRRTLTGGAVHRLTQPKEYR